MSASMFTRVERRASIFARVTGLIRAGLMKWEDRPLWYDVYASHPPFDEPKWDVKMPKHGQPVRKIFYEEDVERANADDSRRIFNLIDRNHKKTETPLRFREPSAAVDDKFRDALSG